jgi:hypothetical protein
MPIRKETVTSYDSLLRLLEEQKSAYKKRVVLFTGSKDAAGVSWCPDCNVADPIIKKCLDNYEAEEPGDASKTLFVTALVGERSIWKDQNNAWRKGKFAVRSVPTLALDGSAIKLEENQLLDEENVKMLLQE